MTRTTKIVPCETIIRRDGIEIRRQPDGTTRITITGQQDAIAQTAAEALALALRDAANNPACRSSALGWLSCLDQLAEQGGCATCFRDLRDAALIADSDLAAAIRSLPPRPVAGDAALHWAETHTAQIDTIRRLVA